MSPAIRVRHAARTARAGSTVSTRWTVAARVAAAVLGGYGFAWGVVAACTSLAVAAGMGFHDAEFLSSLIGVLAFLGALLGAIAARRLWPVWAVLLGGGALLAGVGSAVQAALI